MKQQPLSIQLPTMSFNARCEMNLGSAQFWQLLTEFQQSSTVTTSWCSVMVITLQRICCIYLLSVQVDARWELNLRAESLKSARWDYFITINSPAHDHWRVPKSIHRVYLAENSNCILSCYREGLRVWWAKKASWRQVIALCKSCRRVCDAIIWYCLMCLRAFKPCHLRSNPNCCSYPQGTTMYHVQASVLNEQWLVIYSASMILSL